MGPVSPHISFPLFLAALQAGRLGWILEHAAQITMGVEYELEVCGLIAAQDPRHLLPGSAEFAERVQARCAQQELGR
jgi:hypothetical protein